MDLRIAIVPVGRTDPSELEAAAARVAKILNKAVELRQPATVPRAGDDPARGQHLAGPFLADLRGQPGGRNVAKLVGAAPSAEPVATAAAADATIYVTDLDLYK